MRCPRKQCSGSLFEEVGEHGTTEWVCSLCSRHFNNGQLLNYIEEEEPVGKVDGKEPVTRERNQGGNTRQRHLYIEEHKAEIIADYLRSTDAAMCKKWDISPTGWYVIKKRWAADIDAARNGMTVKKSIRVPTVGDKRKKGYKNEGWPEPLRSKEYIELAARFGGYRQAVLDIFGQNNVETKPDSE